MVIMRVPTTTIDVQHQARAAGTSGYSLYRAAQLAFHVLVGYSEVPLQLVVMLGATVIAIALGWLGWLALVAPADPDRAVQAIASGTAILALIGGLVILAIGTVGVYLTKSFVVVDETPALLRGHPSRTAIMMRIIRRSSRPALVAVLAALPGQPLAQTLPRAATQPRLSACRPSASAASPA